MLAEDRSPVAVLGHKEPEMLIAFLGAIKAGHPYVPIDNIMPQKRVEQIIATAGVEVVLTPEETRALVDEPNSPTPAGERRQLLPSDPYYIMFTSGSTGEPKGVVITLECLGSYLAWMLTEHTFTEMGEIFLNQVPYSFDVSCMDTYVGLIVGGTVFSITRDQINNPKQLYQAFRSSGLTCWVSTPSFASMCLIERSFNHTMLPNLRRFLFCGETLPPQLASQLMERFPSAEIWNTYGPTEATVATTSIKVDRNIVEKYSPLPIGHPMPGTRLLVVDESLKPVPEGERGELVISGPNVSPGYLKRPDLTQRVFFELDGTRAYRTGDWARYRDGLLFFEGRMDSQIKLHGHRIELADIEVNLRALPGVKDAVVLAISKQGIPESLTAFITLSIVKSGSDFECASALKAELAKRLPAYMVPRKFEFIDAFPMNANGKADRRKLAELLK
jgi:D-alanine--poly(phosphoribitol) ligase subunit 1